MSENEAYAGIICHGDSVPGCPPCGRVDLNRDEYMHQMCKPDSLWFCPNCGSTATFDEDRYEEIQEAANG